MKNIKNHIKDVLTNGSIEWFGTSSKNCFRAETMGVWVVLCKYYPKDSSTQVVSLSFLDSDGNIEANEIYDPNTNEFKELGDLYNSISSSFKEKYEMQLS